MFSWESQTKEKALNVSHTKYKKLLSRPFRIKTGNGLYFYTVCTKIYFSNSEKSISLCLLAFPVKTSSLCDIHGAVAKHLSYYFVRPSNLSVNIHTAFWKCNSFFSKAHNSWKPQHSETSYCDSGSQIFRIRKDLFVDVFVNKFQVKFHIYVLHD
jgi:hypothetical protein